MSNFDMEAAKLSHPNCMDCGKPARHWGVRDKEILAICDNCMVNQFVSAASRLRKYKDAEKAGNEIAGFVGKTIESSRCKKCGAMCEPNLRGETTTTRIPRCEWTCTSCGHKRWAAVPENPDIGLAAPLDIQSSLDTSHAMVRICSEHVDKILLDAIVREN